MKKIVISLAFLFGISISAQYMIIGNDSISLKEFKENNEYSLKNSGIKSTIESVQNFTLLQQLAKEKKADTMAYFQQKLSQVLGDLEDEYYFPKPLVQSTLREYVDANRVERKIQIFNLEKTKDDNTDYKKVYNDVVAGKITIDEAIITYTKKEQPPLYIKPGLLAKDIYDDIMSLKPGGYTKLYESGKYVTFIKLIDTRPSLGYLIFGTLSYPNDENAEKKKNQIAEAIKSGKKFNEITAEFGTTENEIHRGGAVMGSPTLPDLFYNALKGKKTGYTTEPILQDGSYYIFHIYELLPYELNQQSEAFFKKEMLNTNYAQVLEDKLTSQLKKTPDYKEFSDFEQIKKSYQTFKNFTKNEAVLFQYNKQKRTYAELKKDVETYFKDLENISNEDWQHIIEAVRDAFVMQVYNQEFHKKPEIKKAIDEQKRTLYSEYIFTQYIKKEIENHPEWHEDFYNRNKNQYIWDERANSRIAIVADDALVPQIQKQIKNIKDWETLKKKYENQLNNKNQILVYFEEGLLPKDADIFVEHKVNFGKGTSAVKIGERTIVLAVDSILPKTPMTKEEAEDLVTDGLTEEFIQKTLKEKRNTTKIIVEPAFMQDLEKNFKK